MTTALLTGLPGSGTSLLCTLLNRLPNTIALASPAPATMALDAFIAQVRRTALERGFVPAGSDDAAHALPHVAVRKPLTEDFRLYISQPAALGAGLSPGVCLYALVRSPLDVLASWQAQGMGADEYPDSGLHKALAAIPDPLDRQVAAIGWFLRRLAQLPPERVIRYEDLVINPAATLSVMQPFMGRMDSPQAEDHPAGVDMALLAHRLEAIAPLAERFYPRFRHTLREVQDGAPIVLRSPGLEGKGRRKRIDFLIAGVQKGGTTALADMLARHPAVRLANRKEVHFFDDERQDWTHPDYEAFHCWFRPIAPGRSVWGEATPAYLFLPEALHRIRRYNPAIRLVICLRHPTFRAHSQWRMLTARRLETLGFAEAISATGRARRRLGTQEARMFSYVERGFYAQQLRRLFTLFPRENVHILRTDRLWQEGGACLAEICGFLGIEPMADAGPSQYLVPIDTRHMGHIGVRERRRLDRIFRRTIEETQALIGLDLSDWLDPDYHEPMPPPEATRPM